MNVMPRLSSVWLVLVSLVFVGCATVPMGSVEEDTLRKSFAQPSKGKAGLYIYRDSNFGGAIKKNVYIDETYIGQTAPKVFLYREVDPGPVIVATDAEFGQVSTLVEATLGSHHFVRAYIKMGLITASGGIEVIPAEKAKPIIQKLSLAK